MGRRKPLRLLAFVVFLRVAHRATGATARRIGAPPAPRAPAVARSAFGWVEGADATHRWPKKKIRKNPCRHPRQAPPTPRCTSGQPPPAPRPAAWCGPSRASELDDRGVLGGTGHAPDGVALRIVLGTSVLVADPGCLASFAGCAVVVPLTVVEELDGLKSRHDDDVDATFPDGLLQQQPGTSAPTNTFVVLRAGSQPALGRVQRGTIHLLPHAAPEAWGLRARNVRTQRGRQSRRRAAAGPQRAADPPRCCRATPPRPRGAQPAQPRSDHRHLTFGAKSI